MLFQDKINLICCYCINVFFLELFLNSREASKADWWSHGSQNWILSVLTLYGHITYHIRKHLTIKVTIQNEAYTESEQVIFLELLNDFVLLAP